MTDHNTNTNDELNTVATGWVLVGDYKRDNDLTELTAKQWTKYRKDNNLVVKNIVGKYYVTHEDNCVEEVTEPTDEVTATEAVSPNVVTFGKFTSSLAVINNSSKGNVEVHNITYNTGALAGEANNFVSQLGAFSDFLSNTDEMLNQRKRDLEEQTRIKRDALNATQLQVENIRQRVLQSQRDTIATVVSNQSLDAHMVEAITEGKSLHQTLTALDG